MAPYTLHVNAVDLPLSHGNWLTAKYEWNFGDTAADAKYNQLVGWNAAHLYLHPGTYPVTLTLTDEAGEKRVFNKSFIIDPDKRRAIYVSSHGNDQYNGDSPDQPVRTLARAARMLRDDTKVLLRKGDTFDIADRIDIKHRNIIFGAYGDAPAPAAGEGENGSATQPTSNPVSPASQPLPNGRGGQNPTIRFVGKLEYIPIFTTRDDTSDIMLDGITFDSKFDHSTEKTGMPDVIKPAGANTTVHDCVFLNVGYGINSNDYPRGVMAQDNSCPLETGLRSYFAWVQGSDHVYLGNYVANSTREHCLRVGGADRILIAYNNFTNLDRRDKDKGGDKLDTAKGAMTVHAGNYVYITNNTVGRGEILLGPLGKEDGKKNMAARWHWAVVENNRVGSFIYINHGTDHVMIRNNIIRRNDWACIIVEGWDETYHRGNADITITNNTGIDKTPRGNFLRVTGKVDGVTLLNNLYIAPNLNLADNLSAPVFVDDESLRSFRAIGHNIWPDLQGFSGVNYVKGLGGYVPSDKWLAESTVKEDRFETLSVPSTNPSTQTSGGIKLNVGDVGAQ